MSDYLALTTIRLNGSEATSALPGAPVVGDGWHPAPVAAARPPVGRRDPAGGRVGRAPLGGPPRPRLRLTRRAAGAR